MCFGGGDDETPSAGATLYRGPGDSTVKRPQGGEISAPKPVPTKQGGNASSSTTFNPTTGLAIPGGN